MAHFTEYGVAKIVAQAAHAGQTDKGGEPYFRHVERVANAVDTFGEKTIAYLHDVIEDTPLTLADLEKAGFSDWILRAVGLLTRTDYHGTYAEYIQEIAQSGCGAAIKVKLADLADNLSPARRATLPDSLRTRYILAQERLESVGRQTDPEILESMMEDTWL